MIRVAVDDPNEIRAGTGVCFLAGKLLGQIPLASDVVGFGCDRAFARDRYMRLRPLLRAERIRGFTNKELTGDLVMGIVATANFGARRANFRWYYIDGERSGDITHIDPIRIERLPDDPKDIMYGFW